MSDRYAVTDVRQKKRFTAGGSEVTYYDITVVTAMGAVGTLRINGRDYSKETVAEKLEVFVDDLDAPFTL